MRTLEQRWEPVHCTDCCLQSCPHGPRRPLSVNENISFSCFAFQKQPDQLRPAFAVFAGGLFCECCSEAAWWDTNTFPLWEGLAGVVMQSYSNGVCLAPYHPWGATSPCALSLVLKPRLNEWSFVVQVTQAWWCQLDVTEARKAAEAWRRKIALVRWHSMISVVSRAKDIYRSTLQLWSGASWSWAYIISFLEMKHA